MSAEIDALVEKVKAAKGSKESARVFVEDLSNYLSRCGTDEQKLKDLATDLRSSASSLAEALTTHDTPNMQYPNTAATTEDAQQKQVAAAAAQQKYQPVQRPPEPPPSPQNVEHGNPPGSPDMVAEQDRQEKDHSNKGTMHRDDDKDAASKDDSSKRGRKHL